MVAPKGAFFLLQSPTTMQESERRAIQIRTGLQELTCTFRATAEFLPKTEDFGLLVSVFLALNTAQFIFRHQSDVERGESGFSVQKVDQQVQG